MARGSKLGERRGGRKPGTPNKRTAELARRIETALGSHPVTKMASLVKQAIKEGDLTLAAGLLKEIATYHSPKRKPIEGAIRTPIKLPADPAERAEAITAAAADGSIALGEAQLLMSLEVSRQKSDEHGELLERIEKLEAAQ
ncbi:MAG: hypothetical protein HOL17_06225 [Gammaproteobacteria bacterium]|jgi:hypothetical protein|nr:hypothetical protein [Gammaproteobacteria bacterium]MBT6652897.1 hypothetical protein [Gammaproteobacteria bacterium]MBT7829777.1 hypothetical protein [Candidatus Neomarinimicrobiota bacterium]